MQVEGVDVVQIGAVDLAVSLGVPGQTTHPKVKAAIRQAAELAKENGKILSFYCDDAESAAEVQNWPGIGIYLLPIPEVVLYREYGKLLEAIKPFC